MKDNHPQLSIKVGNKYIEDVQYYKNVFGVNIYYDSSQNGCYQWSIQSRADTLAFYCLKNPSRSHKMNRVHLINKYYYLLDIRAYVNQPRAW